MSLLRAAPLPFLPALATLALAAGCANDESAPMPQPQPQAVTIVDLASKSANLKTLVSALVQTGLDKTLAGPGPFTVFAPTDDAFARLPAGVIGSLDSGTLAKILTYHVHPGKAPASAVSSLTSAPTVEGAAIGVSLDGGAVYLDGIAKVITTDIVADNGIIHLIDTVLLPPSIAFPGTIVDQLKSSPRFSSLVEAVVKADLAGALSAGNDGKGYTVFAPTNAAFAPLADAVAGMDAATLANVLLYHVADSEVLASTVVTLDKVPTLQGTDVAISAADGGVTLNGKAKVTRTDWRSQNGVVHVIDSVLLP